MLLVELGFSRLIKVIVIFWPTIVELVELVGISFLSVRFLEPAPDRVNEGIMVDERDVTTENVDILTINYVGIII